ncbi:uncharacterized protein LOC135076510 isoform X2 [Ostrinia nubilalis]|uniref:uncharacterized protein LOC135076510 isoform X2 n=1 Tax=Ostrinia nubilalis TaxID=29057 RepID=UPI0030823808
MHFPVEGTRKTLLFFTVLISWTVGFGEAAGDKVRTNGAPALRIRDFEDSDRSEYERHPRAEEKEEEKASPAIRADSFSDEVAEQESSREENAKSSDVSEEERGNSRHRSTKGLQPGEFEPEDNPKVHGRYQDDDEESDEEARRHHRNKREIDYEAEKRKSKKFRSARKQGVTRA